MFTEISIRANIADFDGIVVTSETNNVVVNPLSNTIEYNWRFHHSETALKECILMEVKEVLEVVKKGEYREIEYDHYGTRVLSEVSFE